MQTTANILRLPVRHSAGSGAWSSTLRNAMRPWGITITDLAASLGVSRQYVWQVLYGRTPVSERKQAEMEQAVRALMDERRSGTSFGQRLRGARIGAGLTLRQAADRIGYSWVAVERWEKDICVPKPGVLWHLRHVYGVGEDWQPMNGNAAPLLSPAPPHQAGV